MSEEERQPCTSLEVENNISGVIIGVHKPCSKCLNVRFILSIASFQVIYEKLLVNF
jgi:hypothetical protein